MFSCRRAVLTQSKPFLLLLLPASEEAGGRDSGRRLPKGMSPPRSVLLSRTGWGTRRTMVFDFPSSCWAWWAPLSWKWLNTTCLLTGNNELIPHFALLAHAALALPIKLSLCQPLSSRTFTFLILFPIPLRGERASSCMVLSCLPGLNYTTITSNSCLFSSPTAYALCVL